MRKLVIGIVSILRLSDYTGFQFTQESFE